MPIKFNIDDSNSLAVFTVTGEMTFDAAMEILDAYFKAGLARLDLVDMSSATVKKLTFKQMNQIAEWWEERIVARPANSKTAFVVPTDADYETTGLFQVLDQFTRANWPVKMFYSSIF